MKIMPTYEIPDYGFRGPVLDENKKLPLKYLPDGIGGNSVTSLIYYQRHGRRDLRARSDVSACASGSHYI
jgi:hypothetical protein